ncbi:D-amino acid dehydrogenase [Ramlibacter monticola]|uniref:D-amino acid dehydrogenase n=1 Tax=Ramlibacter monticola TaxID=1926872 RepID=A0A937CVD5_9BURK|nr:D-amino acid dehydrogenase [Ramlibacter monticola]MBL0393604.1 D-amino acid dehydrogenase [Ramlibacter monticola]
MKVAIVGAGIIGVTTAYELAADGHDVTVLERHGAAALETSFANAGVVAPGYVTPWAAPGMPGKVARYLFSRHAPVRVCWPLAAHEVRWMMRWRSACDMDTYMANRARLQRLAFYSRHRLQQLTEDLQLEYDHSRGYLVLLRAERDRKLVQPGLQLLRDSGIKFQEVDAAQARELEPALNPDTQFLGGVYLPDDEVGNCRQFALLLKNQAQALGAHFEFNCSVAPLDPAQPTTLRLTQVGDAAPTATARFDAVVVCGGLASADLLRPVGLRVPLAAVHGYSISAPIREPLNAPRSGVMDDRYKVAISRLGNRVRVAGSAEIGGQPDRKRPEAIRTLYKVLQDWFPGAAQMANTGSAVQEWKGARPMLPDGPPVLGPSGVPGVWVNIGHGSSGWALACGSARALADLVSQRAPEVDLEGLGVERLAS